jgi:hypothetical protein
VRWAGAQFQTPCSFRLRNGYRLLSADIRAQKLSGGHEFGSLELLHGCTKLVVERKYVPANLQHVLAPPHVAITRCQPRCANLNEAVLSRVGRPNAVRRYIQLHLS